MEQKPRAEGARASDVHGSECLEPTSTPFSPQYQPDAIDVLAPWATDDERALRRRIHRAQAAATAKATRSRHGRARALYWWTSQWASDWTFERASIEDLKDVIAGLSRAFLIAGAVERLEAPDAE